MEENQDLSDIPKDIQFMQLALAEAQIAAEKGEVPVGAVVVKDGEMIAKAHNLRELSKDPTAHAELLALKAAAEQLNAWRLSGCTLYVTLEPCPMCAGALVNSRVDRVVYGTRDPKAGAAQSMYELLTDSRLNHRCELTEGVLKEECSEILKTFFSQLREKKS